MAKAFIDDTNLTAIADAIRSKNGTSTTYLPSKMAEAINALPVCDTSDATATAEDMAKGKTAYVNGQKVTGTLSDGIFVSSTKPADSISFENSTCFGALERYQLEYSIKPFSKRRIVDETYSLIIAAPASSLGDAEASDVVAGKTFTSTAGLKVTGTNGNNCEAYHITSTSETITVKSSGTVKVWGYGYKSTSTYYGTIYAFAGDGYYTTGYSYGTPSKTSATFDIDADGLLSGLPSGLTALDVVVTIGI